MPGFGGTPGWPSLNAERSVINALRAQLEALRAGAGPDVGILLDLNFNFKTEGYLQVTRALDDLGLFWFELDIYDPASLRRIRDALRTTSRLLRVAVRRARLQALFRALRHGRGHHRRAVERHLAGAENRRHGRSLRGQRGAAQFLRPPLDPDERPPVRRRSQLPHHGNRHRRRAVEGRHRDVRAGNRERAASGTQRPRLGHRP